MKLIAPAPAYPQPTADKAAHLAAAGPIRVHAGDSDPDMDEALRRVQTEIAYIERDAQLDAEVAKDLAADPAEFNWIPNVAPVEDMWDVAIDAYGTRVWPVRSAA